MISAGIFIIGISFQKVRDLLIHLLAYFIGNKAASLIIARVTFTGVIHHELSHLLFALISGSQIVKVSLFKLHGDVLGEVSFIPQGPKIIKKIQILVTAIAPTVTALITSYFIITYLVGICNTWWQTILVYYLLISIILHAGMSPPDVKAGLTGLPVMVFVVMFVVCSFDINLVDPII